MERTSRLVRWATMKARVSPAFNSPEKKNILHKAIRKLDGKGKRRTWTSLFREM
ncbi:unnamed protein product [Dovyalis caffra]|uniref:Uncharacterized protein n=1 Tax=Dovyalis caffra TaxID=77055 RepID=A0AAV1SAS0_9ROSI|nr:unnamed protein product [Dovyalis caffra]